MNLKEEVVKNMATPSSMAQMKVLDMHRWHTPICQEEALAVLGFKPPYNEIYFGPFTGNKTLMRWFLELNHYYGVCGQVFFLYKPQGRTLTHGVTSEVAMERLKEGLRGDNTAYIYHCENHYFCPIGFEDMPLRPSHAYRTDLGPGEVETWVLMGDPSRNKGGLQCIKWEDINADLNMQNPEYLDIRRLERGVQIRETKKKGGNLHCLIAFKRSDWQGKPGPEPRQTYYQTPQLTDGHSTAVDGDCRIMNGDSRFMNGDSTFMNGDSRVMNGDSRFMNGDSTFMNGDSTFMNGDSRVMNGDSTFMNGDSTFMNGDSRVSHNDIMLENFLDMDSLYMSDTSDEEF